MSYRNEIHNLDGNGDRIEPGRGDNLPGMSADSVTNLPKHVPVQPGDKCSIMCDHPGIEYDASHAAAVQAWKDHAAAAPLNFHPEPGATLVIDVWEANQREMERRVAAGEPLPTGADGRTITPEQVAAWRAERGPGEVARMVGPLPAEILEGGTIVDEGTLR